MLELAFLKTVFHAHLRTHSYYSFLEGLAAPQALAQAASQAGLVALGLTDRLSLSGAVEFYRACRQAGIKPILGLEISLELPARLAHQVQPITHGELALLASGWRGWQNLCALSSALLTEPERYPRGICPYQLLQQHSAGLICLTGSALAQLIAQQRLEGAAAFLNSLQALFPGAVYVELQHRPGMADWLDKAAHLAEELDLPLAAAHSIYYLRPEQAALQRTLSAIRLNCTLAELPPEAAAPEGSHFVSAAEMAAGFQRWPAALAGVDEIIARCNLELPLEQPLFPAVETPPGLSALDWLRQKAEAGAQRRYGALTPEIRQRLEHELAVIGERGYETIFLIVEDILNYARRQGIPTSSRGSAASSLVAYCLGITSPDPIRHNLYFERFLNPARSTPPDIDTDLCSRRRDEVIRYVFDRFGQERAAMVGTINRFRLRSALGEAAKAHGLSPAEAHALTQRLPGHFYFLMRAGDEINTIFNELASRYPSPPYPVIFADAAALLGLPRHLSVHAGGLVIAPGPTTDYLPVQRSGSKGIVITQFDLEAVEQMGLVKIDLLGIRGLTVLGDVAGLIYSWRLREFANPLDVLDTIPLDDPQTAQLVKSGQTIGCFQIESPGMRATLKQIQASSVEDIIRALALYRPGPLKGGLRDAFVRRHTGQEAVTHLHPALAPLLEETYGVILYQEQVLRIAHELAGLSLADADLLRRAMSHFDPGQQMQALKQRFIHGAGAKSGIPAETAERVWELMAAFAGYGFPKAHAASYALVAWRSAWCKAHFPAEFLAAVLANWGGYYSQRVYLSEARRLGLTVRPPHINHAQPQFSVAYPQGRPMLFMGLDQVRELTRRTQTRILKRRPFHSLEDFLARVDPRPLEAENLIRVGALEGLGTIPSLLQRLKHSTGRPGQLPLFEPTAPADGEEDWSLSEKVAAQEELLGVSVDAHPLELHAGEIATAGAMTTAEAASRPGQTVRVAGVRQSWHRSRTARGEMMAFITLEDLDGTLDVIVFPALYRRARSELGTSGPLLVEGVVEMDESRGEPLLRAEKVWRLRPEGD